MSVSPLKILACLVALPLFSCGGAQPYSNSNRPSNQDDPLRQIRVTLSDLKNDVRNHELEIRTFEEKLQNQETTLESFQQQLTSDLQQNKDAVRASCVNLEGKFHPIDNSLKGVMGDLKQLQTQANESVNVLGQYKAKLSELEQIVAAQNEHMKHLEAAIKSLMEILQVKESSAKEITSLKSSDGGGVYRVQAGDSLEKIARINKVSIKALKEANNLTSDKITVGQPLKIPQ